MGGPEQSGTDTAYLRDHQYRDPSNLNARIALHAKYARSDEPWYPWLISRVDWAPGVRVLEVGCGSGALWVNVAPLLPAVRLTLTDLSPGMVTAATSAVGPLTNIELDGAQACDVQDLPFETGAFDIVVANHMLYHAPDPERAARELARVLMPDGALLAATNGPRHLDVIREITREVFGWSSIDGAVARFAPESGERLLRGAFGSVTWHPHPSTMVCTDPADVYAFIKSSPAGQEANNEQLAALHRAIDDRFEAAGGRLPISTEAGAFVASVPARLRGTPRT